MSFCCIQLSFTYVRISWCNIIDYINPTPHLDFTTDHHSDDGDDDTLSNQVMISVIVCSILLMTLLAVLVVSSVKLVKFIKTSQNVK